MTSDFLFSIIGAIAAICTSSGLIPQAIKGIRTKSLDDVSSGMLIILAIGTFLWIVYGIHRNDLIIIAANVVTCSFALIILMMKKIYK